MPDSESKDDMEELQSILNDYSEIKNPLKKGKTVANKKDKPTEWIKSEEEIRLDKLIFGDKEGLLENLEKASSKPDEPKPEQSQSRKRKPAWEDEDDNVQNPRKDQPLKEHLKSLFERVVSTPKWADLDRKKDDDSDEILRSVGFISESKSAALAPRDICMKQLKNLNEIKEYSITSIQFHPTSTVAMVTGTNGTATLYAVDGGSNEQLHRIRFKKFPIHCAKILPCGTQAMFTSTKKYYYTYDLMHATENRCFMPRIGALETISNFEISPDGKYFAANGTFNEVLLFDLKSKDLIHTFKQEDPCQEIKFSLDSTKIISSSMGPWINIFDIRRQRLMHKFIDAGCINGKSMALSPDGRMLATGSAEGVVNIYEYDKVLASNSPQPEKTILNLTTEITKLNFNHTSEILGMCSDVVQGAVKLVHFPTGTVFANFPAFKSLTRHSIREIEFSPSSGFMALGTKQGNALLYRLSHFSNY